MTLTPTAATVLALVLWTWTLVAILTGLRVRLVVTGKHEPHTFAPTGEDVSGFSRRVVRAHANCYEHLPFALAILIYALVAGRTEVTDGLAYLFLAARMAQSVTHLISAGRMAVNVRFAFFLVQLVLLPYWVIRLAL